MLIIGVSGKAGVGKDTFADALVADHNFAKVALADPMKRFCAVLYGLPPSVLWGPSERRAEKIPGFGDLTARHALQALGTEWGRAMHPDTWIRYALRVANELEAGTDFGGALEWSTEYSAPLGIRYRSPARTIPGIVIPDVRFENEIRAIQDAGGYVVRIERPGTGLEGAAAAHVSEAGQDAIPSHVFDAIVVNSGEVDELQALADVSYRLAEEKRTRNRPSY